MHPYYQNSTVKCPIYPQVIGFIHGCLALVLIANQIFIGAKTRTAKMSGFGKATDS